MFHDETTKTSDFDTVTLRKRVHHGIEYGVDNYLGIPPRKMREPLIYLVDQIPFGHKNLPANITCKLRSNRSRSTGFRIIATRTATIRNATSRARSSAVFCRIRRRTAFPTNGLGF